MEREDYRHIQGLCRDVRNKMTGLEDITDVVIGQVARETQEELLNVQKLSFECQSDARKARDYREALDLIEESERYLRVWTILLRRSIVIPNYNSALD